MYTEEFVNHVKSTTNASYFLNEKGQWKGSAAEGYEEVTREEVLGEKKPKKAEKQVKAPAKGKGSEKELSDEEKLQAEIDAEAKAKSEAEAAENAK